jgi:hypothetical protein
LFRIIRAIMFIILSFHKNGPSGLRKQVYFLENRVYNHCGLNCFIEYLHRKLLTTNFLSYDIESAKRKSAFNGFAY